MSEKLLEINGLRIEYTSENGPAKAVNGITFSLDRGQSMGLVGETGAGKTTTALSILRLLPKYTAKVTGGEIRFDGRDVMSVSEAEMRAIRGGRAAMIFQDPMTSLDPVITVRDQIAEVLLLHREDLDRANVDAEVGRILEMVGIPAARMHEYPHQFSGGMKQRVMIAIAIACNPELLIADEPTTALDVTIQAQVLSMMRRLKRELHSALLLITHDLGVVASICDIIGIMYAGEIVEFGTLEDIFDPEKKHHPYTVGLFGSIPNLTMDAERLSPIPGLMPDPTDLPAGCSFGPRCPHYDPARCGSTDPVGSAGTPTEIPIARKGQHQIRCVLYADADL
ncbi:ABC transporter ATP-binding protein [Lawsonibacter celer]|jgi:peptide/nickel transport system ATP-binding protein|uniref:ABC transporter ATP-binding protein n=1 Tax=Lawsonibacter celer TaxID=2986526 RepID=UPI0016487DAA|nr:ABC transporter ATP-binding protein [Lawsonibacter celer]